MRYQTEIFVPSDRYVCLQLPDYLPEGRALVIVTVEGLDRTESATSTGDDPDDHQDIEWWDEFDGEEIARHR